MCGVPPPAAPLGAAKRAGPQAAPQWPSASPAALPREQPGHAQRGAAAALAVPLGGRCLLQRGTRLRLAEKRLNLPNRSVRPSLRIYLLSAFQEHMDKIPLSRTYIYSIYY